MKDNWKGFALSIAVGLILGGGASAAISSAKIERVRVELQDEIDEVEADEEKTYEVVIQLSIAVARLEEKIDAALAR